MKKIYLAGPDVFEPNAKECGEQLKRLVAGFGFIGLFPLDNEIPPQNDPRQTARAICDANLELIHAADIVMANLNPFRGFEPDSGTVFEIGYARALGKDVFCYAADRRNMIDRLRDYQQLPADAALCRDGKVIENFELSHNLMLIDLIVADTARSCLEVIAEQYR